MRFKANGSSQPSTIEEVPDPRQPSEDNSQREPQLKGGGRQAVRSGADYPSDTQRAWWPFSCRIGLPGPGGYREL